MRTLMITFVFNEINYLPHTINYYKKNGCEIYIIDNNSTDGTYEWLIENNISCHRVDTKEAFHVRILEDNLLATVHKLKPDWVIFGSADLYHITKIPLSQYIQWVDSMGFNQLSLPCISAVPVTIDELDFSIPISKNHHNAIYYQPLRMITKYSPKLYLDGDTWLIDNLNSYITYDDGITINYGACKPIEILNCKLERTRKAYKDGMSAGYSVHYEKSKKMNWLFSKEVFNIFDLRTSKYAEFITKINE
jgi:glycosyltransferase involved in cell wall biosynthesis